MVCQNCGEPAKGDLCADCRREKHQEEYTGKPSEHASDSSLSVKDEYETAMPDLEDGEYFALKQSIRKHGLEYPILVDRDGNIVDGHHRFRAWHELGKDGDPPTIVVDTEDDIERALRPNLARRDFSSGQKREAVKRYLENHWDGERTQEQVAEDLGVTQRTVSNAEQELKEDGKLRKLSKFPKEEKRQQVAEYLDDHPDASNREVADAVEADISYRTVGNWRDDLEENNQDNGDGKLKAYATNEDETVAAAEVFKKQKESEDAASVAEEVAKGESKATEAKEELELQEKREQNRKADSKVQQRSNEELKETLGVERGQLWKVSGDNTHKIYCGDTFSDQAISLIEGFGADLAFVDPPYGVNEDTNRGEKLREGVSQNYDFPEIPGDKSLEVAVNCHGLLDRLDVGTLVFWGANNYANELPPGNAWIVWDKRDGVNPDDNSDFEMAWTNQDGASRMYRHLWKGAIKASESDERRIHPTQKPIKLAEWTIEEFPKQNVNKIVDPFSGSGSALIAAENVGVDSMGVELSPEYTAAILYRMQESGMAITEVGV